MYLIGYDVGSSSVKVALVEVDQGHTIDRLSLPQKEMEIYSPSTGWAEQDPEVWWRYVCIGTQELLTRNQILSSNIVAIGIAYQMHGLVLIDKYQQVIRPAIIWCDSRAVEIGQKAFTDIGSDYCLRNLLNAPGNFTASKLKWVQLNEPENYHKIDKILLPGDYISMKFSGINSTTIPGLSEGIFWDYKEECISDELCRYFGFDQTLFADVVPNFEIQVKVSDQGSRESGLSPGTPITYRAGDQPNNALALGVLHPGEIAATGGTSGVVYGISDELKSDPKSRFNAFAHVNHTNRSPRIGQLLCINGAGIQYAWLRNEVIKGDISYNDMETVASKAVVGSEGLKVFPFGNGAERMLENAEIGARVIDLQLNIHQRAELCRATLEGIAFSFVYGIRIMSSMGLDPEIIKVGNDNLFLSDIFSSTIANLVNCEIRMYDRTGAIGAAKASGLGIGLYTTLKEAVCDPQVIKSYQPTSRRSEFDQAYRAWERELIQLLSK